MTIEFTGVTGENRKELAKAIAEATEQPCVYQGTPGYMYKIGPYYVNREGQVEADEFADPKEISQLLLALRARDYVPTADWSMLEKPPAIDEMEACISEPGVDGIVLTFPKNGMDAQSADNLRKLVSGKEWLLRMALESGPLAIDEDEDTLHFPWLAGTAPHELLEACALLIAAMIKLAKKQKRVILIANETDNPRYAFRCFLLRLGFIGDAYRGARKALMRDIPGNGASRRISHENEPVAEA